MIFKKHIPTSISLIIRIFFSLLCFFTVIRLLFYIQNLSELKSISYITFIQSFLIGTRFDILIISYILTPLYLLQLIPYFNWSKNLKRTKLFTLIFSIFIFPIIFLSFAELVFFKEFHERYNQLAWQYWIDDPLTVFKMIWHGYPVIRYLLISLISIIIIYSILQNIIKNISNQNKYFKSKSYFTSILIQISICILLVIGVRGGWQSGPPLRVGDAYFCNNTLINQITLNGFYTLAISIKDKLKTKSPIYDLSDIDENKAHKLLNKLLNIHNDKILINSKNKLIKKIDSKKNRWLSYKNTPKHVVLIMLESFSAKYIKHANGKFGKYNVTLEFDTLMKKGIYFNNFYSQGTHTHQGIFATMCSLPNLPGHEYFMQESFNNKKNYSSLSKILKNNGFLTSYIYNGDFRWDNQKGFFKNKGMDHFIGKDDYISPLYIDSTWGVSDEDLFIKAIEELNKKTTTNKCFFLIQTLSNHAPYDLPPPAPFNDIKAEKKYLPRLNGLKYTDYALGIFFKNAITKPWYKDTLFVILGDHGFTFKKDELKYLKAQHIPLLFIYPADNQFNGKIINTIGSQIDILPTILGLIGIESDYDNIWGRDLFKVKDKGWAIIKPSGNNQSMLYIKNNKCLLLNSNLKFKFFNYNRENQTTTLSIQDKTFEKMKKELKAFINISYKNIYR